MPDRPCISWTDAGEVYSFSKANAEANRLARGFAKRGVKAGDLVVLFLPNCLEYVLSWWALAKLGAAEVTVGDSYKGQVLRHQINLSGAKLIVTTAALTPRLAEIQDELAAVEHCVLVDDASQIAADPDPCLKFSVSPFSGLYDADASNLGVRVAPSDTAAILFTSGTSGPSKGVTMSHSQLYFFAEQCVQLVRLTSDDVYMTGFPLFHGNAQFLTVYPSLIVGAKCVLYPKFSVSEFLPRAVRSGATVCNLIGATFAFLCSQPPSENDRKHSIKRIYTAPLLPDLASTFSEKFGVTEFVEGFGLTETSLVMMTPPGISRPPGASGVLVDQWYEVRLADPETGDPVEEGQVGELLIRPRVSQIMCDGYLNMPEKTIETWRDLWFHTGDGLRRDADGWYYFVDRMKDALRRRGENISSFEVEAVLDAHPAIAESAVIGVSANDMGGEQEVKAFIIFKPGAHASFEEIIKWCDDRMPHFMVPRFLEVLDELPRTPTQKVKKKELREREASGAVWDRESAGRSSK